MNSSRPLEAQDGPYFGDFGGRFVPEALIAALDDLTTAYAAAKVDPAFQKELAELHRNYTGRPTPTTAVTRYSGWAASAGAAKARPVFLQGAIDLIPGAPESRPRKPRRG